MIFVFYFFAAILVFLGCKSLRGGIAYFNFFKSEIAKPESDYAPFCSLIAPCRGLDQNLRENLAALLRQNYPLYEVIFVADDLNDEAVAVIKDLISRQDAKAQSRFSGQTSDVGCRQKIRNKKFGLENSSHKDDENKFAKLVIAPKARDSSQKVENLREAVTRVSEKSEIFVFADSDARPDKNWLRNLIAPLRDETIGAATGYRWFISEKNNFASRLRSVWNASVASALGANTQKNFCWGGATAIRREIFEKIRMREKWRGTLSDDFAVTRLLKQENLPIVFVPQALTASVEDCGFRELLEFTTRQMKITRVYAQNLWKASLIGSFLFIFVFWTGAALLFFVSGWRFWLTLFFLILIFALGFAKAWLRLNAVKLALKKYEKQLNRSFLSHATLWTITPAVYFYNCARAFFSNEIRWRGIRYKLESPDKTVLVK